LKIVVHGIQTFFNTAEPHLLIAGGEELDPKREVIGDGIGDDDGICEPDAPLNENCYGVTGFAIGGLEKATDADNVYRQKKQIIRYVGYRTTEPEDYCNCRYEGYWDGKSWYKCYKPILFAPESELRIYDNTNQLITKNYVDQCQFKVTGGNKIEGCAGTETSVSGTKGTQTDYTRKITAAFILKGADICFKDDKQAAKDENGNIICYNYDYSWQPVMACYDGTWNNSTWRCEETLSEACADLGAH
jgi:hypothetical protein